jgi:hypothetical protein
MDAFVGVGTDQDQSLVFLGSYAGHRPICDTLILTNHDYYQFHAACHSLTTSSGTKQLPSEQVDCAAALYDFSMPFATIASQEFLGAVRFPRCRFCRPCKMPGMPNMAASQFQAVDRVDEQSPQCVASAGVIAP